jgi:outer membrane biosynthesis protein TonB
MRGDYPPGTGGYAKRNLSKDKKDARRKSNRSRVCLGSRADFPEDSNKEEPAPYLVAADSRDARRVSYRSAAGMQDYINKKLPGIRNAYDTAADNNPALGGGKIVVRFDVAPDGHVVEAEITEDTFGDAALRGLILSRVRRWKFAGGGEADVTVEYPFVFVAEKE